MVRVTSGKAKNYNLKTPQVEGFRAVQEVAKQSLFSVLGEKIVGAVCLDLYAGSGNLGIEALSKGAKLCDFVDENKRAIGTINENLEKCGFTENAEVIRSNAVKYVANTPEKYDVIFVDPFYDITSHIFLMKNIGEILEDDGVIAFFHGKNLEIETLIKGTNLKVVDKRRFGRSFFTLITK